MVSSFFRNKFLFCLFLIIAAGVILAFSKSSSEGGTKGADTAWQSLLEFSESVIRSSEAFGDFSFRLKLVEENRRLEMRNAILKENVDQLREEIQELNIEQICLSGCHWLDGALFGKILYHDISNLSPTWALDLGTDDGVSIDDSVVGTIDGQLGLIGKISTVSKNSSFFEPLHDSEYRVLAQIEPSNIVGLVNGNNYLSNTVFFDFVSKDSVNEFAVGDKVVTSSLSQTYPGGLPIGVISEIENDKFSLALKIAVRPHINMQQVRYVYVLKSLSSSVDLNSKKSSEDIEI